MYEVWLNHFVLRVLMHSVGKILQTEQLTISNKQVTSSIT